MTRFARTGLCVLLCFGLCSGSAAAASEPTVEEMAAQMLMVGFRGTELDDTSPIIRHIKAGHVGNVILFERDITVGGGQLRNIVSPEQLTALSKSLQDAAPTDIPLWIAIDQEGGRVQRLRPARGFAENYPSAQVLGYGDVSVTRDVAKRMGLELREMGINVNFAPVADVNINRDSPVIGRIERSFSHDPGVVAQHVIAFSDGLREAGVIPCLKHFPGHGSADHDTHIETTDVTLTWQESELLPYRIAFESGFQGAVMTSHVLHRGLDPQYPASLSYSITTTLLREKLGWDGVVVTDDLHMGALMLHYSIEQIIYRAVSAGADVLIFASNSSDMVYDPDFPQKAHDILVNLVIEGRISKERLYESWSRIVNLKSFHDE